MNSPARNTANIEGLERERPDDLLRGLTVVTLGHDVATRYAGGVLALLGATVHEVDAWGIPSPTPSPWSALKTAVRIESCDRLRSVLDEVRPASVILGCGPGGHAIPPECTEPTRESVVRITPFNVAGPWAGFRGGDLTAAAAGGMAIVHGAPGRPPLRVPFEAAEKETGLTAASLLIAATRHGAKSRIAVAMTDVVALYARVIGQLYFDLDLPWRREGSRSSGCAGWYPYSLLPASDGQMAIMCRSGKQWRGFIEVMGDPEWGSNPRYLDRARMAREYPDEVDALIEPWLRARTRQEIMDLCQAAGVPFFPVFRIDEAAKLEYPRRRNLQWTEFLEGRIPDPPAPAVVWGRPAQPVTNREKRPSPKPGDLPLAGLRVLDFGWVGVGPHIAMLLGELGATVIKVESSERMDYNRLVPVHDRARYGTAEGVQPTDAVPFFHVFNRGKRSIDLSLGTPAAARALEPLVRWADVVVENFTAGTLARAALPPERMLELNSRLVIVSLSVAGQESPIMRGFAPTVLAAGGMQSVIGYEGELPVGDLTYGLGDYNGAQFGFLLTLAALRRAEQTGRGAYIDASQIEGVLALGVEAVRAAVAGEVIGTQGNRRPGHAPHDTFPTAEHERWVAIDVPDDDAWVRLAACIGEPWCTEARWRTYEGRDAGREELGRLIAAWSRTWSAWDTTALLQTAGVPAFPVLGFEDLEAGRHGACVAADIDAGPLGHFPIPIVPWRIDGRLPVSHAAGPALGADTQQILCEICGFSKDEAARVRR